MKKNYPIVDTHHHWMPEEHYRNTGLYVRQISSLGLPARGDAQDARHFEGAAGTFHNGPVN